MSTGRVLFRVATNEAEARQLERTGDLTRQNLKVSSIVLNAYRELNQWY